MRNIMFSCSYFDKIDFVVFNREEGLPIKIQRWHKLTLSVFGWRISPKTELKSQFYLIWYSSQLECKMLQHWFKMWIQSWLQGLDSPLFLWLLQPWHRGQWFSQSCLEKCSPYFFISRSLLDHHVPAIFQALILTAWLACKVARDRETPQHLFLLSSPSRLLFLVARTIWVQQHWKWQKISHFFQL